jgi:NADPH:quinone reductase-like Zn-dependent oxidoreductase
LRAVIYSGIGGPEVITAGSREDPIPAPGQVLVSVSFAGINPADVLQREGRYMVPAGSPADIAGPEVAGIVLSTGPGVTRWKPGDRVFGLVNAGGLADRVVADADHLAAVPPELDDRAAAAAPEAFITAHDAIRKGRLTGGGRLVVTGGNGGVGTAAVQIGVALGAAVLAGVRTPAVRDSVSRLGAEVLAPDMLLARAFGLGGADVILELISASAIGADIEALAPNGTVVIVGVPAGADASFSVHTLMARRASVIGTVLRARTHLEKAATVQAFESVVVPLLAARRIRPLIDSVFPYTDAAAAFYRLSQVGKLGKVLLSF